MQHRLRYLPLPGISSSDPNFHDPARYADRARFAQPMTARPEPDLDGERTNVTFPNVTQPEPTNPDYTQQPEPSPFKLGGR